MKLYTFDNGDGVKRVGVELSGFPGLIRDVRDFGLPYRDMTDLIRHITPSEKERISDPEAALDGHPLRLSAVRVCSPIPHPEQDIICLGVNYAAHADERAQFDRKAFLLDRKKATYFSKRAYQTSGPDDLIPSYPELVTSLDYEAELAVIIGRDCKNVRERDVAACIFGYTVMNDVSARNLQTEHNQWYFGKSLDGFTPMGPCIVTEDEVPYPPALSISSTVNGELRQNSNTKYLLHSISEIIAELSQGMTLLAGTIIATGTPAGVGMGFNPPKFLKSGDIVTCEIEKIGSLTNMVK